MIGIDLGITVSSVNCITQKNEVIDYQVLIGNKSQKNEWKRIMDMSEAITDVIDNMIKANPDVYIAPLVAIEEPVYPYRTRNPRSYFNMCCLYALVRRKLQIKSFKIYSIHPLSVKATAKAMAFKGKRLKKTYMKRGSLTKKGMIRAYNKVIGKLPPASNNIGRETLADSFFIARAGIDRRKVGLKSD